MLPAQALGKFRFAGFPAECESLRAAGGGSLGLGE